MTKSIDEILGELVQIVDSGQYIDLRDTKAELLQALIEVAPEKLSLDDLDPREKINRVEYARFCNDFNQGVDTYKENIRGLFK